MKKIIIAALIFTSVHTQAQVQYGGTTKALNNAGVLGQIGRNNDQIKVWDSTLALRIPALGQALAAASVPVVLTAAQISTLTPQTNALTDAQLRASAVAISASSLPLPTGAATSANQTTIDNSINTLLKPASTLTAVTTVGAVTSITNALPSGNNNIGDVDIASALPTGTNTIGNVNQTLATAGFSKITDGTNTMPTGDANTRAIFYKLTDGTNNATIKAASTAAATADPSLVVSMAGANSATKIGDGTNNVAVKAASAASAFTDPALAIDIRPGGILPAAASLADAGTNPSTTKIGANNMMYNGATWDLARSTSVGNNVAATGIQANTAYGQYNTTLPTVTAANYTAIQTDVNGRLLTAPKGADLQVTVTAAAAAVATASLPAAGAGLFHYITHIDIDCYTTVARAGGATPVIATSTNLTGTPSWNFASAAAIGTIDRISYDFNNPVKSTTANTATTIVGPATTSVIWKIRVYYYTAP
jgi:hypothetical protein